MPQLQQVPHHNEQDDDGPGLEEVPGSTRPVAAEDVEIEVLDPDRGFKAAAEGAAQPCPGLKASQQQQQQQQQQPTGQQMHGQGAAGADGADAAAAPAMGGCHAPLITTLEVLVVWPLLAQHRLTTLACWQLLLHEHQLMVKLSAMQGLFFQQQGDWVELLCEGLEHVLQRQQPRPSPGSHGGSITKPDQAGSLSPVTPVAAQLLLESAIQQSCLVGSAAALRLSLEVRPLLPFYLRVGGSAFALCSAC
jgi:hypothetical protein